MFNASLRFETSQEISPGRFLFAAQQSNTASAFEGRSLVLAAPALVVLILLLKAI